MSGRRIYFNIRHKITNLLNPALCLSCGIPINADDFFCGGCVDAFQRVPNPCSCCGLPSTSSATVCPACRVNPPRWQHMIAPLIYQGQIRKQIHDLKFNEKIYVANALLSHLWPIYANRPVDVLLPVPLHQSRLLERGFNQSTEIALILSRHLNIPLDRHSLTRIKATEFQFGLSLSKRQKNLLKAFCFNPEKQYQSVAIIDDIITSGSTMTEICKQLRKSGIKNIEVWSLARALKHD